MNLWKNQPYILTLLNFTSWLNYYKEVISLKKTLISGMFSSVSDAELVTAMLDAADFNENMDTPNNDLNPETAINTNEYKIDK